MLAKRASPCIRASTAVRYATGDGMGLSNNFGHMASTMYGALYGKTDSMASSVRSLPGRAAADATYATVRRSTVFENWNYIAPAPVSWAFSKLGTATCKMWRDREEATDSLQLQVIKGLNTYMIDCDSPDTFQPITNALREALMAFELPREGIVIVCRAGVMREQVSQEEQTKVEMSNNAMVRERSMPLVERVLTSSIPVKSAKRAFVYHEMTEAELRALHLWRLSPTTVAAITPQWLEGALANVSRQTGLETIDVFLVEGIQGLYGIDRKRPMEEIEKDLEETFSFLEAQVQKGVMQFYGVSDSWLAPPLPRVYPPMPPDAMTAEKYLKPYQYPPVIELTRLLKIAEKIAGPKHHLRFISYPFNMTQSQAFSTILPYAPGETLCTLAKKLGLVTLATTPLEAPDLQDKLQRYHRFPAATDLSSLRMMFCASSEKAIRKEVEIMPYVQKLPNGPKLEELFIASVYFQSQRFLNNLFHFEMLMDNYIWPSFRRALVKLREGSPKDVKDWVNQYEVLVRDMFRLRAQMFNHKHYVAARDVEFALDEVSPKMRLCPVLAQKALNFATFGADVVLAGFHRTRYFHEATELNPGKANGIQLEVADIEKICRCPRVSFVNTNPPHPYLFESLGASDGRVSGKPSPSRKYTIPIDPANPVWPDIPKGVENNK